MSRRTTLTVAAAAVIATALTITGCSAGGGTTTPGGAATGAATTAAAPKAPGLNTPVTVGSFEYTATGSKDAGTTVGTAPLSQTAQGTFIRVDLTVKNVGNSAATFLSNYVKLVDGSGKTFDADPTATLYASPDQSAWIAAINPGNNLTGPILFDVPAGTKAVSIEVSDNAFSAGKTIDLG
jgi:hypothetical protein